VCYEIAAWALLDKQQVQWQLLCQSGAKPALPVPRDWEPLCIFISNGFFMLAARMDENVEVVDVSRDLEQR
jgi:hypothetical protein